MRQLLIPAAALLLLVSCKEKGPSIDSGPVASDTAFVAAVESPQLRVVTIEEATGVKCSNCPEGTSIIASLESSNPGRIIAVGMHALSLTDPYSFSVYDFRTQDAEDLINDYFGGDPPKPMAVIDRIVSTTGFGFFRDRGEWTTAVNDELAVPTPVNVVVSSAYSATDTQAVIKVHVAFTGTVSQKMNLTVGIVEDGIIDVQEYPSYVDTFYTHNHVLRDLLTPYNGSAMLAGISPVTAGQVYERTFVYKMNNAWNPDHCRVFAIVHHDESADKEVEQSAECPLK